MKDQYSQLKYFIKNERVPRLNVPNFEEIEFQYGLFLAIQTKNLLHEAIDIPAQSIEKSWRETQKYIEEMIEYLEVEWQEETKITDCYYEFFMDNEVEYCLYEELGSPPVECCPIYLITVEDNESEKIVYIGRLLRSQIASRGHLAALKLHHPDYNKLEKKIYFANVMLLGKSKEYIPLEYVHPLEKAEYILSEIEASLIFYFKPVLNTQHKLKENYEISSQIHIQNFLDNNGFLNNRFIGI